MGAAASIDPAVFHDVKTEYEAKKAEGISDEALFEHMKSFIEAKSAALAEKPVEAAAEAAPAPVTAEEAKPVEDATATGAAAEAVPVEAEAVTAAE